MIRKAVQKIPGATEDTLVYVHEIGNPFCLCEMQDGSLVLLPAVSLRFIEPPKPEMDVRTTIAAMAMQGYLSSGYQSKNIVSSDAVKLADYLIETIKNKT
ncbi:hypothetical protein IR083_09985 [Dysgonomonas sp. GY75]|uniref:hypothetical protein n=1 Tax=Dysgonomonas sp. GY75 TaxID=2780419 RepID=UPI0018839C98|nr:hypothetical protein [Dysgonomonas sp. GY75]MBF0649149.1 hypothetical protein [Dysgonomonas sp. GY75]